MRNCSIANGEVLNTNINTGEMESWVQESLDEYTSGMIQFKTRGISEKEVRMSFIKGFNYDPDKPAIYDSDMTSITGVGIGAFQFQAVGGYPMIYPLEFAGKNFYPDITSSIRFYKSQPFEETGQAVEHTGLRCYLDRILMQIIFQSYER